MLFWRKIKSWKLQVISTYNLQMEYQAETSPGPGGIQDYVNKPSRNIIRGSRIWNNQKQILKWQLCLLCSIILKKYLRILEGR